MLHKDDCIISVLKDAHTSINEMRYQATHLTSLLSPSYHDCQHINYNVEQDRGHQIPLSQALMCLEIMTYFVIHFNSNTPFFRIRFNLVAPGFIKFFHMQCLLEEWPFEFIVRFL